MVVVYLGLRVILVLLSASNNRPSLISVSQIAHIIADNARRAGVHQCLDTCLLAGVHDGLRPVDIDLFKEILGGLGVAAGSGASCVDDNVGLELLEDRL